MGRDQYVVGVDFGTLSARALVVRAADGTPAGTAVHQYAHQVMDTELAATGEPLPPDWALQDPQDYREALRAAVPAAIRDAGIGPGQVVGIGTDFTASTVLPVLADGTPLCRLDGLKGNKHAYVKLWKHHAAQPHADRINDLARERGESWLPRYGGKISSEWQFAKALQLLDEAPELYQRAERWIEAADWIIWQLAGRETRNACTAGYKGIRQDGKYPSREFLAALDPRFETFAASKLDHPVAALGTRAGSLTAQAAAWTGLPEGIAVAAGNVDAHVTAPAAGGIKPGQMVAITGTSTCHVMNSARAGRGAGHVRGGGRRHRGRALGLRGGPERGGRHLRRLRRSRRAAACFDEAGKRGVSVHEVLSGQALRHPAGASGLIALDWLGGNRSVLVDHHLSGAIVGLTLASTAPEIYRALVEATAFGTRVIIDAFTSAGLDVAELIMAGGLLRNELFMRVYADVMRRPLCVIGTGQGPALGSAIHAAVAAGVYPGVPEAAAAMGTMHRDVYRPDPASADVYDELYAHYVRLHDYFGRGGSDVMHRLRDLRDRVLAGQPGKARTDDHPERPRASHDLIVIKPTGRGHAPDASATYMPLPLGHGHRHGIG